MNPILYLLLIAIGGGILAIVLAVPLVIFIVGVIGGSVAVLSLFSKWRKDSIVQRSVAAEWLQRAAFRPARESPTSCQRISLPKGEEVLQQLQNSSLKT
jgi:hypothetical protein